MDYEKKYNEALERAKQKIDAGFLTEDDLSYIFPELRESEDESIRKGIIEIIKAVSGPDCDVYLDEKKQEKYLAWIEKQKEQKPETFNEPYNPDDYEVVMEGNATSQRRKKQKPAEWNDTDMKEARNNLISVCRDWERGEQTTLLPIVAVRARYFLEHLTEPKSAEWSEEDEAMLDSVIRIITRFDDLAHEPTFAGPKWTHPYTKELNFLEKLRNRLFEEND